MTHNPLLDLGRRLVIAHRGASAFAPENTLEAFRLAATQGAEAFELDVRLARDGEVIVLHDPTLDRTTNGTGPAGALTAGQLSQMDAGHRFSPDGGRTFPWRGRGVRIPLLREVLAEFPAMPLLIETKEARVQEAVARAIEASDAFGRCVIASEDPAAVQRFRAPPFHSGASGPEIARLYFGTWVGHRPRAVPYQLLAVPWRHHGLFVPTPRFIRAAKALGCPVHVWTVDSDALARKLWDNGASGMITNRPSTMVALARG